MQILYTIYFQLPIQLRKIYQILSLLNSRTNGLSQRFSGITTLTTLQNLFDSAESGLTFFITSANSSTEVPGMTAPWLNAVGLLLKRDYRSGTVILYPYNSSQVGINTVHGSNIWSGWSVKS